MSRPCPLCELNIDLSGLTRQEATKQLIDAGHNFNASSIRNHQLNHNGNKPDMSVTAGIETFVEVADHEAATDWFKTQGVDLPPADSGLVFKGATVTQSTGGDGEPVNKHWLRVVPAATPDVDLTLAWEQAHKLLPNLPPVETVKRRKKRLATTFKCALITPDLQLPFLDYSAWDVVEQIAADVEAIHGIDQWIDLGDRLDLPEFSKHLSAPNSLTGVSAACSESVRLHTRQKMLAPNATQKWIMGNHEQRLTKWLVERATPLLGLTLPVVDGEQQVTAPILSIEFLARTETLGVQTYGPYPEGIVWLNNHLRAIHGDYAKAGLGQTAATYLKAGSPSTIFGHTHRAEILYSTSQTRFGTRNHMAGSPGTLCRLDGAVPSYWSGIDSNGCQGKTRFENWQHGLWVVFYEPDGQQRFTVEPVQIWNGHATWRGRHYTSRVNVDGKAL